MIPPMAVGCEFGSRNAITDCNRFAMPLLQKSTRNKRLSAIRRQLVVPLTSDRNAAEVEVV